jgi:hypothetical protein
MANFSLADIQAAAEAKYSSTKINISDSETVELRNALRLGKDERKALTAVQGQLDEDGADQQDLMEQALVIVAASKAQGNALIKAIGGDLAVLAEVFAKYGEETQAGEASPSQD